MRIEIVQPHPDYPFAWVKAGVEYQNADPEKFAFDVSMVLSKRDITIIGPWEKNSIEGTTVNVKAPVLLETQRVKPRKKAAPKRKK